MGIKNNVVIMVGLNKGICHLANKSKRVVRTMMIGQAKRDQYGSEGKGMISKVNASLKSRDLGQIHISSRKIEMNVQPEKANEKSMNMMTRE